MKQITTTLVLTLFISALAFGQFKDLKPGPGPLHEDFQINTPEFKKNQHSNKTAVLNHFKGIANLEASPDFVENVVMGSGITPSWISTKATRPLQQNRSFTDQGIEYIESLKELLKIDQPDSEFVLISKRVDKQNKYHMKYQQYFKGLPVDGAELIAHAHDKGWYALNGSSVPTPELENIAPEISKGKAQIFVQDFLNEKNVYVSEKKKVEFLSIEQWKFDLVVNVDELGEAKLAWKVECRPNFKDHYVITLDAVSGNVIKYHNHICSFINHDMVNYPKKKISEKPTQSPNAADLSDSQNVGGDGPSVINDTDLSGVSRLVNGYQKANTYFMIDATKSMYRENQSTMPDQPTGVIWTIDAGSTSPERDNFTVSHVANNNNNWRPLEVSAHHNGGQAFEYFLNTFGRNSINGSGGNIVSIINVVDKNENEMDNAFWNGVAMYYGNGIEAFDSPLARSLDVAGHEMSHGVIQNTANLEYVGQSGALNESFADIFGAMIDRDDWQMGENVVNTNIFTTGALRDLSNPNNGGTKLGDPGWQPKHMNEFANLPNTVQGDNGGVHINSGIVNHAYYKYATAIGKDKAEKVYFKALEDYLVKSSKFIDARNAVIQSAADLYGTTEVNAAKDAFNQVGIGEGSGENYEEELNQNPGADIVICTDPNSSAFYYVPPNNPNSAITLNTLTPPLSSSRMSITDDGSEGVYVDQNGDLRLVRFNWSQSGLDPELFFLENNPSGGWRNVVISKDGNKIAYQTADMDNRIFIFDFVLQDGRIITLFNPTTANGGNTTGDVEYADAMEFDYSGESLMYDAKNKIAGSFGDDITYWDISFLKFWENSTSSFATPQVSKLFTALPENVSVGNPTFAKNSPFIIAYDFIETERDIFGNPMTSYTLKAANLQTGRVSDVFNNAVVSWPSYSKLDDQIMFNAENINGTPVLATIDMQPDDKIIPVPNTAAVFVSNLAKGTWSQTGERSLNVSTDNNQLKTLIKVFPNPSEDNLTIDLSQVTGAKRGEIFNHLGQLVEVFRVDRPVVNISLRGLNDGIFVLKINTDEGLYVESIVKQSK